MNLKDRFAQGLEQQAFGSTTKDGEKAESTSPITLDAYIRDFGFYPGKESMPSEYVEQFYMAMKLEKYIKDLKISIATEPDNQSPKQLVEKEVQKIREKTTYTEGEREALHPTNSMDIDTITDLNQLPEIMPDEWLLEEVNSDLFLKKATEYALLRPVWTEVTKTPHVSTETVFEKEFVEVQAPKTKKKQHAFVLRDISSSTFGFDNRFVLIRGLALAFLRQGYLQGSEMGLRDFDGSVHPLHKGKTQEELRFIAEHLLTAPSGGSTDIEAAIQQAVKDIKQGGKFQRADILLLTDGEATLSRNPLGDIKLHTIMVGEEGANPQLQAWSETFQYLSPENIPSLLQPKKSEISQTGKSTSQLAERMNQVHSTEDAQQLAQDVEAMQQAVQVMRRHDLKASQELSEQEQQLSELQQKLGKANRSQLIETNTKAQQKKEQEEAEKQAEKERWELLRQQKEKEELQRIINELSKKSLSQKQNQEKGAASQTPHRSQSSQGSGGDQLSTRGDIDPLSLFRYLSRKVKQGASWSLDQTKRLNDSLKHLARGGETDES